MRVIVIAAFDTRSPGFGAGIAQRHKRAQKTGAADQQLRPEAEGGAGDPVQGAVRQAEPLRHLADSALSVIHQIAMDLSHASLVGPRLCQEAKENRVETALEL